MGCGACGGLGCGRTSPFAFFFLKKGFFLHVFAFSKKNKVKQKKHITFAFFAFVLRKTHLIA